MEQISRIGIDTSKHVHGVNTAEQPGSAEDAAIPVPRKKYVEARGQVLDHTAQRSPSQACGRTTVDRVLHADADTVDLCPDAAIASVGTQEPMVRRLFPGGNWIRTSGPPG